MNQLTNENSHSGLLAALTSFTSIDEITFEYRVYYNEETNECLFKTIYKPEGKFVLVTRAEYDAIQFCPDYTVDQSGNVLKKKFDFSPRIMLLLADSGFKTLKHNNIFVAPANAESSEVDFWKTRRLDER